MPAPPLLYVGSVDERRKDHGLDGAPYDRTKDLSHPNPTRRRGNTVIHPAQPWTATTHAYLHHLHANGFEAAPTVIGSGFDDDGHEVLSWIEGTLFAHTAWPNPAESLYTVGQLLRQLHDVSRTFVPPADAQWMPWTMHTDSPSAVISHGNIAPWHVIFRDGQPVSIIGWEYSGPVDPLEEIAVTAWYSVQFHDDDIAEREGLPPAAERARWYRSFLDGYELPRAERAGIVDLMLRWAIKDNGWYARTQGFRAGDVSAEGLWVLTWQSRAALWTIEHEDLLTRTATAP